MRRQFLRLICRLFGHDPLYLPRIAPDGFWGFYCPRCWKNVDNDPTYWRTDAT